MAWATSWRRAEPVLRSRRLPRIRTLLLATYLTVLLLPVAGIGMLRLYESALLRQTEADRQGIIEDYGLKNEAELEVQSISPDNTVVVNSKGK